MSAIYDLSRREAPKPLTVDVCVIGSGSAGATAARILAESGKEVLVLEEGPDLTGTNLTQRGPEMYDQLYMDRGGRATNDLAIAIMQARVLGGGGVINMSDVVPISEGVLEHWVERHDLHELAPDKLATVRATTLADLRASRISEEQMNLANRLLRDGATRLGFAGEAMLHNRVGCAGLGSCLVGCPINAKRNPRFVAIPAAMKAGARFFVRARATKIADGDKELKRITVRTLDEQGYHEIGELEVKARRVIVAANAIATPQLLLRSGLGNDHVGRHLILQPQLPIVAMFEEPVIAFRGIPQAYAVTEFENHHPEHGLWGFRIEAVMGGPGIVASMMSLIGTANAERMTGYDRIAASLLLVPDRPSGRVTLTGDGRPDVSYVQADDHKERLLAAIKAAARIYFAAGARHVIVPTVPEVVFTSADDVERADAISLRPASAPLISAHQQGSVRMARSEELGAADPDGRVFGTRDVYVFDTSLYPSSASSHTMAPAMTIAHHLANRLAASSG